MSVANWLKYDLADPTLCRVVSNVVELIDRKHKCPPPEVFSYSLQLESRVLDEFPLDGCDVEWDDTLDAKGFYGVFIPYTERPNNSRCLIQLSRSAPCIELVLIHEIGHLAHGLWFKTCTPKRIASFQFQMQTDATVRLLRGAALLKLQELRKLKLLGCSEEELRQTQELASLAEYNASPRELFARTYTWAILRGSRFATHLSAEVQGRTPAGTPLYPADCEKLADLLLRVFSPGWFGKLPWSKQC